MKTIILKLEFKAYENLQTKKQSDRYQYVLPYYNFDKNISQNYFNGNVSLTLVEIMFLIIPTNLKQIL